MATSLQPVKSWKKKWVEVVKGWILAGWAQKSPEPWLELETLGSQRVITQKSSLTLVVVQCFPIYNMLSPSMQVGILSKESFTIKHKECCWAILVILALESESDVQWPEAILLFADWVLSYMSTCIMISLLTKHQQYAIQNNVTQHYSVAISHSVLIISVYCFTPSFSA